MRSAAGDVSGETGKEFLGSAEKQRGLEYPEEIRITPGGGHGDGPTSADGGAELEWPKKRGVG